MTKVVENKSIKFINNPFSILDRAFHNLYPDKDYRVYIESDIQDDDGNTVYGFTQFNDGEIPLIAISAELTIKDAIEIFAHELAHIAAGIESDHDEKWEQEFENIFQEYNEIIEQMG